MPRIRRVRKTRRAQYEPGHIKQLLDGVTIGASFGCMRRGRCDYAAMQAAWNELRDELLTEWVAKHPFTRPLAYWLFDAKEPRLRTIGEQRLESIEGAKLRSYRGCFFGSLNIRLGAEETRGDEGEWETEKQYLCRLDLLNYAERELL